MDKVNIIASVAAPLLQANIDTDTIIRVERLTQHPRDKLGPYALETLRYREDGSENPDFVLNMQPYRGAAILLAGDNFGCGSSREGAVWALKGSGVRCVIAPSFGEIFYNNCFQNGLLPVRLNAEAIERIAGEPEAAEVVVNLASQTIRKGDICLTFDIEPMRRAALMEGLDDVSRTLGRLEQIHAWQQEDRRNRSWVWLAPGV